MRLVMVGDMYEFECSLHRSVTRLAQSPVRSYRLRSRRLLPPPIAPAAMFFDPLDPIVRNHLVTLGAATSFTFHALEHEQSCPTQHDRHVAERNLDYSRPIYEPGAG